MLLSIPMEIASKSSRGEVPIANWLLIAANIVAYFLVSPTSWWVGSGTGLFSIFTYAFVHFGFFHLLFNVWYLWIFGNAVNRRIGNGYYLLLYLGSVLVIGIIVRLFMSGYAAGSSGAVFAVLAAAGLLMPAARVDVHYVAFFPLTILIGLIRRPRYPLFWWLRWGTQAVPALSLLVLFTLAQVAAIVFAVIWYAQIDWSNLGHLFGVVCGIGGVLLLPSRISMGHRARYV